MLPGILFRLEVVFAGLAALLVLLCVVRRLPAATRKELWLKLGVYYLVVHAFLILIWLGGWWLRLGLAAIALAGCREMLGAQESPRRAGAYEILAYAASVALVLSAPQQEAALWILGAALLALLSLPVLLRKTALAHRRIASALFAISVAGGLTWFLVRLRATHAAEAVFLYLIVVLGDAFTQVGGLFLGRTPWFKTISPRKTLEGTLCGLLACLGGAAVFRELMPAPLAWTAALSVLIAVCGNLGDLAFSALKRSAGLKDFGTLLPAHGGVLDRFDGLLFSGPVFSAAVHFLRR